MSMNSFHSRSGRATAKPAHKPAELHRPAGMQRADVLLVAQKHVESRTRARQLIGAGRVCSDTGPITKPGQLLPETAVLTVSADGQNSCCATGATQSSSAGPSTSSTTTANS